MPSTLRVYSQGVSDTLLKATTKPNNNVFLDVTILCAQVFVNNAKNMNQKNRVKLRNAEKEYSRFSKSWCWYNQLSWINHKGEVYQEYGRVFFFGHFHQRKVYPICLK